MVIDNIQNAQDYYSLVPNIKEAFEFAKTLTQKPVGRYECDVLPKDTLYAMVQEGTTGPACEGRLENHRKYIDIQIMLDGSETVVFEDASNLLEVVEYDETKDAAFFEATKRSMTIDIIKDRFYLVFPQDGHMPCRHVEKETKYRKIVVKLRIN